MTCIAGASPPHPQFSNTAQRRQIRLAWGRRAGLSAYKRGVPFTQNAFEKLSDRLPMYYGWQLGWREAARS